MVGLKPGGGPAGGAHMSPLGGGRAMNPMVPSPVPGINEPSEYAKSPLGNIPPAAEPLEQSQQADGRARANIQGQQQGMQEPGGQRIVNRLMHPPRAPGMAGVTSAYGGGMEMAQGGGGGGESLMDALQRHKEQHALEIELERMVSRCKVLDDEVRRLSDVDGVNRMLQEQLKLHEEEARLLLDQARVGHGNLTDNLNVVMARENQARAANERLIAGIRDLTEQLRRAKHEIDGLNGQKQAMQNENERLRTSMQQVVDEQRSEVEQAAQRETALEEKAASLNTDMKKLRKEYDNSQKDLQGRQGAWQSATQEVETLKRHIRSMEQEQKAAQGALETAEVRSRELFGAIREANHEKDKAMALVRSHAEKVRKAQHELQEERIKRAECESEMRVAKDNEEHQKLARESAERESKTLKDRYEHQLSPRAKLTRANAQIGALEEDLKSANDRTEQYRSLVEEMKEIDSKYQACADAEGAALDGSGAVMQCLARAMRGFIKLVKKCGKERRRGVRTSQGPSEEDDGYTTDSEYDSVSESEWESGRSGLQGHSALDASGMDVSSASGRKTATLASVADSAGQQQSHRRRRRRRRRRPVQRGGNSVMTCFMSALRQLDVAVLQFPPQGYATIEAYVERVIPLDREALRAVPRVANGVSVARSMLVDVCEAVTAMHAAVREDIISTYKEALQLQSDKSKLQARFESADSAQQSASSDAARWNMEWQQERQRYTALHSQIEVLKDEIRKAESREGSRVDQVVGAVRQLVTTGNRVLNTVVDSTSALNTANSDMGESHVGCVAVTGMVSEEVASPASLDQALEAITCIAAALHKVDIPVRENVQWTVRSIRTLYLTVQERGQTVANLEEQLAIARKQHKDLERALRVEHEEALARAANDFSVMQGKLEGQERTLIEQTNEIKSLSKELKSTVNISGAERGLSAAALADAYEARVIKSNCSMLITLILRALLAAQKRSTGLVEQKGVLLRILQTLYAPAVEVRDNAFLVAQCATVGLERARGLLNARIRIRRLAAFKLQIRAIGRFSTLLALVRHRRTVHHAVKGIVDTRIADIRTAFQDRQARTAEDQDAWHDAEQSLARQVDSSDWSPVTLTRLHVAPPLVAMPALGVVSVQPSMYGGAAVALDSVLRRDGGQSNSTVHGEDSRTFFGQHQRAMQESLMAFGGGETAATTAAASLLGPVNMFMADSLGATIEADDLDRLFSSALWTGRSDWQGMRDYENGAAAAAKVGFIDSLVDEELDSDKSCLLKDQHKVFKNLMVPRARSAGDRPEQAVGANSFHTDRARAAALVAGLFGLWVQRIGNGVLNTAAFSDLMSSSIEDIAVSSASTGQRDVGPAGPAFVSRPVGGLPILSGVAVPYGGDKAAAGSILDGVDASILDGDADGDISTERSVRRRLVERQLARARPDYAFDARTLIPMTATLSEVFAATLPEVEPLSSASSNMSGDDILRLVTGAAAASLSGNNQSPAHALQAAIREGTSAAVWRALLQVSTASALSWSSFGEHGARLVAGADGQVTMVDEGADERPLSVLFGALVSSSLVRQELVRLYGIAGSQLRVMRTILYSRLSETVAYTRATPGVLAAVGGPRSHTSCLPVDVQQELAERGDMATFAKLASCKVPSPCFANNRVLKFVKRMAHGWKASESKELIERSINEALSTPITAAMSVLFSTGSSARSELDAVRVTPAGSDSNLYGSYMPPVLPAAMSASLVDARSLVSQSGVTKGVTNGDGEAPAGSGAVARVLRPVSVCVGGATKLFVRIFCGCGDTLTSALFMRAVTRMLEERVIVADVCLETAFGSHESLRRALDHSISVRQELVDDCRVMAGKIKGVQGQREEALRVTEQLERTHTMEVKALEAQQHQALLREKACMSNRLAEITEEIDAVKGALGIQVNQLTQELEATELKLSEAEQASVELAKAKENMEGRYNRQVLDVERLQASLNDSDARLSELTDSVTLVRQRCERASERAVNAEEREGRAQAVIAGAKEEVVSLRSALDKLKEEARTVNTERGDVKRAKERAERALVNAARDRQLLVEQIRKQQHKMTEDHAELVRTRASVAQLQEENAAHRETFSMFSAEIQRSEKMAMASSAAANRLILSATANQLKKGQAKHDATHNRDARRALQPVPANGSQPDLPVTADIVEQHRQRIHQQYEDEYQRRQEKVSQVLARAHDQFVDSATREFEGAASKAGVAHASQVSDTLAGHSSLAPPAYMNGSGRGHSSSKSGKEKSVGSALWEEGMKVFERVDEALSQAGESGRVKKASVRFSDSKSASWGEKGPMLDSESTAGRASVQADSGTGPKIAKKKSRDGGAATTGDSTEESQGADKGQSKDAQKHRDIVGVISADNIGDLYQGDDAGIDAARFQRTYGHAEVASAVDWSNRAVAREQGAIEGVMVMARQRLEEEKKQMERAEQAFESVALREKERMKKYARLAESSGDEDADGVEAHVPPSTACEVA